MKRTSILYRHQFIKKLAQKDARKYQKKYEPVFKKFEKLLKDYIRLYGYNPDYTQWVKPLLNQAFQSVDEEKIKEYMYRQNRVKYFAMGFIFRIDKELKKKNKKKS